MEYSKFQKDIFNFTETGKGHGIVNAVAGSGKTTTIIKAMEKTIGNAIFLAFNKSIATELSKKVPSNVETSTLHAAGLKIIRSYKNKFKIETKKIEWILNDYQPLAIIDSMDWETKGDLYRTRNVVKKMVGLVKNTFTDYTNSEALQNLADFYDVEYFPAYQEHIKYVIEESLRRYEKRGQIDFDDMIWIPVIMKMKMKYKYDWVFVDETQDLNKTQLELVLKLVKDIGRIIAVGDPKQSIYGFRGADTGAMDNMKSVLNATELPLSVCYRCPSSHVDNVKNLVPQIESFDKAIEGTIESIEDNKFIEKVTAENNPLILSRVNSLCTKYALQLLAEGYKAVIKGKDFGRMLQNIIKKLKAKSLNDLHKKLYNWKENEISKLNKRNASVSLKDNVNDKYNTLIAIIDSCDSLQCVTVTLERLFSDDDNVNCFTFSTVHKAKGLEAETVYILAPSMFPLIWKNQLTWEYEQELNIKYVAYTRSLNKLVEVNISKN